MPDLRVDAGGPVVPPPLQPGSAEPPLPSSGSEILKLLTKLMPKLNPLGEIKEVLELEEVVGFFSTDTPPDFDIRAGLLLRRQHGGSYLVAQVFLGTASTLSCDSLGNPYGRIFRTLEFDRALQDLFRGEDLIVFT